MPLDLPWHERRLWQITPVRDAIWITCLVLLVVFAFWFGYQLRAIFTPVLIALALAYLFDPIITLAERRWNVPRPATIAILIAVLLLIGGGLLAWLGPKLVEQVKDLARAAPAYLDRLAAYADTRLSPEAAQAVQEVAQDPMAFIGDKAAVLLAGTGQAVGWIGNVIGKTTLVGVTLFLVPIYFFFFAWQFGPLTRYFRQYIPQSRRERVLQIIGKMDSIVATYFRARVVIALLMGVMFSIGWSPLLADVPYWLLLGMGSGLLSLVPFASAVGWPLAVGLKWLAVTSGDDPAGFDLWAVVVWPSAVYMVVQGIESWLLTPLIQGKSLDMSAVTILIIVFIGGSVGGLYGLLLCIPIAACLKILCIELVLPRLRRWAAEN